MTAIQLANDLFGEPKLKDLDVHLFAIEPVPGMGNISWSQWKHIFYLPTNVKTFFGTYAQDARSVGFTPLVPLVLKPAEGAVYQRV